MPDRDLKRGDSGPDVSEAQDLLNRNGAILETDGKFGKASDEAVREFQQAAGLPVNGVIDAACWERLRGLPEPSPDIPTRTVTFICREEVTSRRNYDTQCARPIWPGEDSGVTIGVGYDIGYQKNFEADWKGLLTVAQADALRPWLGKKGQAAAPAPSQLTAITIPWQAAWAVFVRSTLPAEVGKTRNAFTGPAQMSPLCLGALVSLVYNRGAGMDDPEDAPGKRQEMRDIRDAIAAGRLADIPGLLRSMKRLWPNSSGLRARREREAELFEEGLR
jgi:hypothetical protein